MKEKIIRILALEEGIPATAAMITRIITMRVEIWGMLISAGVTASIISLAILGYIALSVFDRWNGGWVEGAYVSYPPLKEKLKKQFTDNRLTCLVICLGIVSGIYAGLAPW